MANKGLTFNKSFDEPKEQGLPSYADTCGIPGCTNETNFVMIKVASGSGIQYRVASDVLVSTAKPYKLKDGFTFMNWFVRCGKCLQDGIRNKKAREAIE